MATELGVAYLSIAASTGGLTRDVSSALAGTQSVASREGARAGKGWLQGFALGGAVAGVAGVVVSGLTNAIGDLASEAVTASDATDKFKSTLKFAGLGTGAIDEATAAARKYADETVYDLATIQNTSAQLASNGIKNYGDLTMAAGNLNAVAGGNNETFKSVAMVLTQTAGAGKLTTENWNQLANAIPGASGRIQEALKKNGAFTGNFRDAMAKGQISAEEFNKALLELGNKPVAVEAAKSTKTFEGAIGNLKATIVGGLSDGLNAIKPALTGAITLVSNGLGSAINWIKSAMPQAGAAVKGFLASFSPSGGVGALGSVLTLLSPLRLMLEALRPILPQIAASFAQVGGQLAATLLPVLGQLAPILQQVVSVVVGSLTQAFAAVLPVVTQLASGVLPVLAQVLAAVVPVFLSLVQAVLPIVPLLAQLVGALLPPLAGLVSSLLPAIMPLVQAFLGLFGALQPIIGVIIQLVQSLIPPLMAVIAALVPPIAQVVQEIAGALVPVFGAVGELVSALMPIIGGLVGVIGSIVGAVAPVVAVIIGALLPVLGKVISIVAAVVVAIVRFVADGIKAVTSWAKGVADKVAAGIAIFTGLKDKVVGALAGAGKWLVETGGQLLAGLWKGINDKIDWLRGLITSAMNSLPEWVRNVFGIHSPSRVFAKIGGFLMSGLAAGIADNTSTVTAQLDAVAARITSVASKAGKATKKVAKAAAGMVAAQKVAHASWWSDERVSAGTLARMLAGSSGGATLADFAQARAVLGSQIKDAQSTLKELADARAQMKSQIASSITGELDLVSAMKGATSQEAITNSLGKVTGYRTVTSGGGFAGISSAVSSLAGKARTFAGKMSALISAGYPAGLVQYIAGLGTDNAIAVASELLSASPSQQASLVSDYGALNSWASSAGDYVAGQMYDVGIAAQQDVVNGLLADDAKLVAAAERLADKLTKAVKKKLGIKSPSRVFRDEVGLMVARGTAQGLERGRNLVMAAGRSMLGTSILGGVAMAGASAGGGGDTFHIYEAVDPTATAQSVSRRQRGYRV